MDKWQKRQAEQLAAEASVSVEAAAAELFPEEAPAARRRRGVAAKDEAPKDEGK